LNESVVLTDSVVTNILSANTEPMWMLIRKLICEVNGEMLNDMLVSISSPLRWTKSYKEPIQPGNAAKLI